MGRASDLNERILIDLVRSGEWEIDADGRVWRLARRKGLRQGGFQIVLCERGRIEHRVPKGYLQVRVMIDGHRYHCGAHRLVWQHFKGDIPLGEEINHDNGLKDDNRPNNLLCGTGTANVKHAHKYGLKDQYGQKNPAAKLTDNEVAQIRLAYSKGGHTMEQLAVRFGVVFQTVSDIVRGHSRPKQGGPTADDDLRHSVCDHDPTTGRFVGKAAGRLLDGREWNEMPALEAK